jgi:hypothetical protein
LIPADPVFWIVVSTVVICFFISLLTFSVARLARQLRVKTGTLESAPEKVEMKVAEANLKADGEFQEFLKWRTSKAIPAGGSVSTAEVKPTLSKSDKFKNKRADVNDGNPLEYFELLEAISEEAK